LVLRPILDRLQGESTYYNSGLCKRTTPNPTIGQRS